MRLHALPTGKPPGRANANRGTGARGSAVTRHSGSLNEKGTIFGLQTPLCIQVVEPNQEPYILSAPAAPLMAQGARKRRRDRNRAPTLFFHGPQQPLTREFSRLYVMSVPTRVYSMNKE